MLKIVALLVRSNKLLAVIHFSENFELAIDTAPPAISPQPPPLLNPLQSCPNTNRREIGKAAQKAGANNQYQFDS
jgi:hypothetical protein